MGQYQVIQYMDWGSKGEEQEREGTEKKKSEEVMAEKFPNSIKPINNKSKRFSDHKHKKHKKKQ